MKEEKNNISGFFKFIDLLIIIFSLIGISLFVYLRFLAPEKKTEMVTHINEVEDVNGKKCVVQVVYYENKDGSGEELLEVKLNGYSDTNGNEIVSFGVQILGNSATIEQGVCTKKNKSVLFGAITTDDTRYYSFLVQKVFEYDDECPDNIKENLKRISVYSESDNLSYKNVDAPFDDFGFIRVEIDGKMYRFSFGYEYETVSDLILTSHYLSTFSSFVMNIKEKIATVPVGKSKQTFGFKNMFKVEEFKNNQWENITNQDDIFNYCYMDFTHYTSGAKTARDSLFKQIQYNTNWSIQGASLLDDHFGDEPIHYLSENDCKFTFNQTTNKHDFDITENCYNNYKDKKDLNLVLILDESYLTKIPVVIGKLKENSLLKKLGVTKYYIKNEAGVLSGVIV